nr:HD domain-containing protein [Pontibacillus sp. HN14]
MYHTVSMLRLGDHISNQYKEVKKDLVMAGIALHDMGKVVEYTNYFAPDYSKVGNFLGHITIINMFIDRKVQVLKEEMPWTRKEADEVYELMHVINAHHGKLEYGSPVESKILEAEVVHQVDMMDSRINMITYGLQDENLQENEAKRIYPMGMYYRTSQSD